MILMDAHAKVIFSSNLGKECVLYAETCSDLKTATRRRDMRREMIEGQQKRTEYRIINCSWEAEQGPTNKSDIEE